MSAILLPPPPTPLVLGLQATSSGAFLRIGTVVRAPEDPKDVQFVSTFNTSTAANAAELRLFDLSTVLPVPGSTLSTISTSGVTLAAPVVLAPGSYDVQLRLVTADAAQRAVCTSARLV